MASLYLFILKRFKLLPSQQYQPKELAAIANQDIGRHFHTARHVSGTPTDPFPTCPSFLHESGQPVLIRFIKRSFLNTPAGTQK